jgi:integrase
MGWTIKGSLYKRKFLGGSNTYISPKDPTPGTWCVVWQENKKRHELCLHTDDEHVARERWAEELALIHANRVRNKESVEEQERRWLLRVMHRSEQAASKYHQITGPGSLLKISDTWQAFLDSKLRPVGTSERTLKGYKQQFDRFARWSPNVIKHTRDLSPSYAGKYIASMEKDGLSADTIKKHVGLLELVFRCVDPDWKNPWKGLHSTKEHAGSHFRNLTHAECTRIYNKAVGEFKTLVLFGYSTGQRLGDLAGIKWSQVDLAAKTITIMPAKTFRRTKKTIIIPATKQLCAELHKTLGKKHIMPSIATMYDVNPSGIPKRIGEIMRLAEVHDTKDGKASFHSFRHTFDTMLAKSGAPLQVCAYLLGHALPGMSGKYIHMDNAEISRKWIDKAIMPIPKL